MVTSFIDILGFKKLIETRKPEKIDDVLNSFNRYGTLTYYCHKTDDPNKDIFHSVSVSDCSIRLTRIPPTKEWIKVFQNEIEILAAIQLHLSEQHILIRGGITYGDMSFKCDPKHTSFFGPAYLKAYEIESKTAVYPRIVIDKECGLSYSQLSELNYVTQGKDGEYFIDYLELGRESFTLLDIDKHKRNIEYLLETNSDMDSSITSKLLWLALYHNWHAKKYNQSQDKFISSKSIEHLIP